jgi:hypothetical protein
MTRHGQQDRRGKAPALGPKETHIVDTAHDADNTQMAASPGLSENAWARNARPAELSMGCRAARKPTKAQPEIVKSP